MDLREGIRQSAEALGVDPVDLATAISYETGGTFDPRKRGPRTQWGQHRGLIQFGEPQARQFGVNWDDPIGSQLGADGAVVKYLKSTGVQPGMGLLDIYSAINAGGVGRYDRSDANNGGAPGTVRDKVEKQMGGHRAKAAALFGGTFSPVTSMVEGNVASTPEFTSRRESMLLQRETDGETPNLLEGAKLAVQSEWSGSYLLAQMGAEKFAPDDNFRFTPEIYKELTDGLHDDYLEMFDDAVSLEHAKAIRARADKMVEMERKLGLMGGAGAALRIGAAVADPVAIGAAILTDGVAAPAIFGAKVTRVGRALRAGVSAGAVNAGVEGYIASQNPTRGATDVLVAGLTGLAVGGALGAFIPTKADLELETVARNWGKEIFEGQGPVQSLGAHYNPEGLNISMSAAERQLLLAEGDAPTSALGKARIDMVGTLKQSEHPVIRRLAGHLAEDGVGNADGSVLQRAASENISHAMKTRMAIFYRTAEPAFKAWTKEQGIPLYKRAAYRETFFDEVGKAVRREDGFYTADVHVNKVANAMRQAQKDLLNFAKEKGLRGFDQVAENTEYLMRVFHHRKLDELTSKFGEGKLNRMIANSLVRGSDELDYEDALTIAQSYLKSIRSQKYQDVQLSRIFSEDQADMLETILKEQGDVPTERIANIVSAVRKPQADEGKIARGKRRLRLDETYREVYRGADGEEISVGIEDFLDNNAERLMTLYTRQITGAGFMSDALSHFKVPRMDGEVDAYAPSFETILGHIRETAGEFNMSPSQLRREIGKLETLYKANMGIPLKKGDDIGEALRLIRDYNFIRVMNQVGFAQIAEIGNILGNAGFRATMQNIPALRKVYSRAKDGSMSDELLDEIEVIWGTGTDRLRHTASNRMDDYGVYEGAGIGKIDNAIQTGKHITADISLMAPINMALHRMATRSLIQRFMNTAVDGSKPLSASRRASLGLSDEMLERVSGQMREHVYTSTGILGRNVKRINIDEWDDQEAASAFINAIDRWGRKVIQENDIGQMSEWMTTDLGKTLVQFRSFMVAAWTKQALTGAHHRDWDTFVAWSMSMLFGGLTYMAQTQINSVGREDREEYLAERLSTAAIGRSAFQRAGFSTIVPGATDTMLQMTGFEPAFAYGRTTGLNSGAVFGNPSADLLTNGLKAARGVIAAGTRSDYDYSQQDARALSSLLAFQNAMVIRNISQSLTSNLPRFSE